MMKLALRATAMVAIMIGASGCSSVPDWVDPTTWLDSDTPPAPQSADNGDDAASPDLANLPAKPTTQTTPDSQKQVADSLAADRTQANYSGEALKGGTEPSAPPPTAPSAADQAVAQQAMNDGAKPAPAAKDNAATASDNSSASASDNTSNAPAQPAPQPAAATPEPAPAASASTASTAPDQTPGALPNVPAPAPTATASTQNLPPPPGAEPAVPLTATASTIAPSSAALGFKPSSAPPLDPSVAQFVPGPIMNRYHETASMAGISSPAAAPVVGPQSRRSEKRMAAVGGPEAMSGAVVANFDALQQASATNAPAYASPSGAEPVAVVFFPGDGTTLSAEARAKVRDAVTAFQSAGGQGFIKVVGHSSSRTSNMPVEKHLEVIFERSQARAAAVAHEIIREGVPAAKVLIEAVGDSQPVYYESMPKGEDGNRRAEIFLQS